MSINVNSELWYAESAELTGCCGRFCSKWQLKASADLCKPGGDEEVFGFPRNVMRTWSKIRCAVGKVIQQQRKRKE